jgi:hypothetical protein
MRLSSAGLVAIVAALLLPALAQATVRKVDPSGSDSSDCNVVACKTISYTVDQAETGDTVEIGAGTYAETVETFTVLNFVGAGAAATTVRGKAGSGVAGHPAFILPNGGSLKSLRVEGGEGGSNGVPPIVTGLAGGNAIVFEPSGIGQSELKLDDVFAMGGPGGSGSIVSGAGGSSLLARAGEGGKSVSADESSFVAGEGGLGSQTVVAIGGHAMSARIARSGINAEFLASALDAEEGASVTLESSLAQGVVGAAAEGGFLTLRRSLVQGTREAVYVSPGSEPAAEATVVDSVLESEEEATARAAGSLGTRVSKLVLRGSTVISKGGAGPAVEALASTPEQPVTATLRNTIALHQPGSGKPQQDLVADAGTIDAQFSSYTASIQKNGGTAPAPGGATNISGDPGFATGSLRLAPNSPLIDRGDPSIVEPEERDIEGSQRSLDGNHDCVAAPDIGAVELTGQSSPCPPPKVADAIPVVSGFAITNKKFAPRGSSGSLAKPSLKALKKGTKFTYSLSEPARVAISIEMKKKKKTKKFIKVTTLSAQQSSGRQSLPFSGVVKGRPLTPGRYRATITATDSAGQASQPGRLSFQVVGD